MQDEPIIQTKELTKSYGPHVALDKLNISIPQGATGLLGQNGAGKSTFLKTVLGLVQATSGEGTVLGYDIRTQGIEIRQRIGYMPEYDALNPDMDAIHQVRYSGELLGMNPTVAMNRAHEALQFVGIGEQRYREIGSFSTGMKQATKLACAIIHDPDLLIADEPSNGLDTKAREFMIGTLNTMVNDAKRSVLMASHLMEDVERVCENIILLHKGTLAAQGKIEDLKAIDREIEIHVWGCDPARGTVDGSRLPCSPGRSSDANRPHARRHDHQHSPSGSRCRSTGSPNARVRGLAGGFVPRHHGQPRLQRQIQR